MNSVSRFVSRRSLKVVLILVAVMTGTLVLLSVAGAVTLPILPGSPNDLAAAGQGSGQSPASAAVARRSEPPLLATPRAKCGPGSNPEPGIQGRVPANSANNGLRCNLKLVAHQGTSGGFKTFRYVDSRGHVCGFYDTALLFPTNGINPGGASLGVAVLDMSNPAHPVQTDTLDEAPMLSPHESLNLNVKRGLLAAVSGNPATYPGMVSIYDAHVDCRHPVLESSKLVARFGHESGFSSDGRTFYATSTALPQITAIDVTDLKDPHPIWEGNILSHGMSLSDDGNRAYIADPTGGDMLVLDTSEIQARKPNPQAKEVSRLTWKSASIPQNAIPFTEHGHPYVLEFDEYTAGTLSPNGSRDTVGAGRIIDISDETKPFVVAQLRLQVNQPAEHKAAGNDPGTFSPAQGYAAHYCNIPTRVDPKIVACSFIASGLRVFNISDLLHPREVGYFVAPTKPNTETGYTNSDYAMSQPAFDIARHDIWYTDGGTGFYVLHVANGVWPGGLAPLVPGIPKVGCPRATGRLSGRSLGPATLGVTRARARQAFYRSSTQGRPNLDFFCLTPIGIRVGYPSGGLLKTLSPVVRRRVQGRVVLALSANPYYVLDGVRPGARLTAVARHLRVSAPLHIGLNTWYLVPGRSSRGVLKVRHGVIQEVGIAEQALVATRRIARRLLAELA